MSLAMEQKPPMVKTVSVPFDSARLAKVEDFRFGNRINSLSDAVRRLIDDGLAMHEAKQIEAA
jgi:hypothetical protein